MSSQEEYMDQLINSLTDDLAKEGMLDIPNADISGIEDILAEEVGSIEELSEESTAALEETEPAEAVQTKEAENKAGARKAARAAKKAERLAKREAKKAEKRKKQEAHKSKGNIAEEAVKENADMGQDILFDKVGFGEEAEDIFAVDDVVGAAENMQSENAISEDELFAGIASMDLFGDAGLNDGELDAAMSSVGEDSLAQVINDHQNAEKKSLFKRFVEFITEEDEEEEAPDSDEKKQAKDEKEKKKKEKKPKKNKKGKNAKGENPEGSDGEDAENSEKDSKKKKKKDKKPKKEKAPRVTEETPDKSKKLPLKKVMAISGVGVSLVVMIVVSAVFVSDYSVKRAGKRAYYAGNYQECYQSLYGKELNESEQVMYNKSESILTINMWLREYEMLAAETEAQVEALDSLIQSVYHYPALYAHASEWNAQTEVAEVYSRLLTILSEKYHISETQAMEIAGTEGDIMYTKKVMAIAAGEAYGSWNESGEAASEEAAQEVLKDVLPEEADLGEASFVDNKQ